MKRDYIEFQDRSVAVGYLITFRCYGTWLHGDERGSVDRRYYNRFGTPKIMPNAEMVSRKEKMLKQEPFFLGKRERAVIKQSVIEVCEVKGYPLFAINVRTNHAHVVTGNAGKPERMMNTLKSIRDSFLESSRFDK